MQRRRRKQRSLKKSIGLRVFKDSGLTWNKDDGSWYRFVILLCERFRFESGLDPLSFQAQGGRRVPTLCFWLTWHIRYLVFFPKLLHVLVCYLWTLFANKQKIKNTNNRKKLFIFGSCSFFCPSGRSRVRVSRVIDCFFSATTSPSITGRLFRSFKAMPIDEQHSSLFGCFMVLDFYWHARYQ